MAAALIAFTAAATTAQTVASSSDLDPKKEDTIVLSPFTVSTDKDVGFVATSSLAGGRMATDLKDTPLAYSVITKEFLDALAINDTETAMDWAVNSYQSRGDAQDRIQNLDGGTRTRSRGVIVKSLRNFFELGQTTDVYSVDRARHQCAADRQRRPGRRHCPDDQAGDVQQARGRVGSRRGTLFP